MVKGKNLKIQTEVYEGQSGYVEPENKLSHKEQLAHEMIEWVNNNIDIDSSIINECYEWHKDNEIEHIYIEDVIRTLKGNGHKFNINPEWIDFYARLINFGHPDIYVEVRNG